MTTATNTLTRTKVNVATRSVVYVANEMQRLLLDIVNEHGLDMDYMHEHAETIQSGLRTWMAGRWLTSATLEIYDTASDRVVRRYDLVLGYETTIGGEERFETQMDRMRDVVGGVMLDPWLRYRVVVSLVDGAPDLPGWAATSLRDISHLSRYSGGNVIDTSYIGVNLEYWA